MRLFIATTFPAEVIRQVDERLSRVKAKLPAAAWVRTDAQHLTFAFLGEQPESLVESMTALVTDSIAAIPEFEASLESCGFFPNPRHARVGWVGVRPDEKFHAVADAIRTSVTTAGVQLDRSDFRPHLTLCRIRDRWPPACIETFQKALGDYASAAFLIDRVTLFSSQLHPKGAIHTPVREFALQGH
jgi:2'-5' RNA ligase